MLTHQGCHPIQFSRSESAVVLETHRLQPELRGFPLGGHMHVRRLTAIAGEEEQTIRPYLQDGRTHASIVSGIHRR
jgi:hypothetical protein